MKFLRSVKGCTILDKIRNEDICKGPKIFCIKIKSINPVCHADYYQEPHYTIFHVGKETEEGPLSIGFTKSQNRPMV